jgi:hypothetical protein
MCARIGASVNFKLQCGTDFAEVQSRDKAPANECANTPGKVATCFDADGK